MTPMNKILFIAVTFAYACAGPMEFPDEADEFYPIRGTKEDNFDWALFRAIASASDKNVVVSPLSVKILLSIIAEAAQEGTRTKAELSRLLSDNNPQYVKDYYNKVLASLEKRNEKYELLLGSKIFVGNDVNPTSSFLERVLDIFHVSAARVDFSKADKAANVINEWAAKATKGNIRELVEAGDLETAAIVLTNAIYFKGSWVKPFAEDDTADRSFTLKGGKEIRAPFMFLKDSFYYADCEELKATFLRMAYKGDKYAMTFILPHEVDGLDALIAKLSSPVIQIIQTRKMHRVEDLSVEIPKFKFDFTIALENVLQSLGISQIFSKSAQLPGLGPELYVSKIKQKAGIAVDERGTEAFAATVGQLDNRFGQELFMANHPFVYYIEDESTGSLLFAGIVANPTK